MRSLDDQLEDFIKGYPVRFYIRQEPERIRWKQLRDTINAQGLTFSAVFDRKHKILFVYRTNRGVEDNGPDDTADETARLAS